MKLQQLKYLVAIAENNLSITHAAEKVYTSQPGISKQLRLLEEELNLKIFIRNGKQLAGITPAGEEIIGRARNILQEVSNIKRLSREQEPGSNNITLSLATTQTQAKYVLPSALSQLQKKYKNLKIELEQGSTEQIIELLTKDKVDFAIISGNLELSTEFIKVPCYQWDRLVVFPVEHPLGDLTKLNLKDVVKYPLITYNMNVKQSSSLMAAAQQEKLQPNVVFTAADADVIKTYVRSGLGVGIIASMAFEPKKDRDLIGYSTAQFLPKSTTWLVFKKGAFFPSYMKEFVQIFAPHVDHEMLTSLQNTQRKELQHNDEEALPMHNSWQV